MKKKTMAIIGVGMLLALGLSFLKGGITGNVAANLTIKNKEQMGLIGAGLIGLAVFLIFAVVKKD